MNGILLLDKPEDITSFKAIELIKKKFRFKKIGHAGTLDSFASGLLIVGINEGTKLLTYYIGRDKTYDAVFRLGIETDTLDPTGTVMATFEGEMPSLRTITDTIQQFTGDVEQLPPAYSAVKVQGQRASERIRRGENVELKPRCIHIHEMTVVSYEPPELRLVIHCGKGTYIRSLAKDIGDRMGCHAHVKSLRRTKVGTLQIESAVSLDDVISRDDLNGLLVPLAQSLPFLPSISVDETGRDALLHGRPLSFVTSLNSTRALAVCKNKLVAVIVMEGHNGKLCLRPERIIFDE